MRKYETAVKLSKGFAHFLENVRELQIQARWKTFLSKHVEFLELEHKTPLRMFQVKCANILIKTPTKQLPLWSRRATVFQINNIKYIQKCLYLNPCFCTLPVTGQHLPSKGQLLCHAGLRPHIWVFPVVAGISDTQYLLYSQNSSRWDGSFQGLPPASRV